MAEKKTNLPAKQEDVTGGFNLPIPSYDDGLDVETLKELEGESNNSFEVEAASCPFVSIRQKEKKGPDGRTIIFQAGGFKYTNTPLDVPDADGEVGLEVSVFGDKSGRTYFRTPDEPKPNCKSSDDKFGVGDPGGLCTHCQLSQWVDNAPPACKPHKNLFCYDHTIKNGPPLYILTVGRSSLRAWADFKKTVGKFPLAFLIVKIKTVFKPDPQPHFLYDFELKRDENGKPVVCRAELIKAIKEVRATSSAALEHASENVIADDESTSFDPDKLDKSKEVKSTMNDKFPEQELPY